MSDGSEKHPRTNMLWSVSTKNDDWHVLLVCPKYRNLKRKPSTPFFANGHLFRDVVWFTSYTFES